MERNKMLAMPNIRYIATILDGAIILLLNIPFMFFETDLFKEGSFSLLLFIFSYRVIIYVLFDVVIPICTNGQTIGRKIFKLRLIKDDYTYANYKNFLLRASIFIVIAFIGEILVLENTAYFLWLIVFIGSITLIYTHPKRKTVHDHVAKTVVVYDEEFQKNQK